LPVVQHQEAGRRQVCTELAKIIAYEGRQRTVELWGEGRRRTTLDDRVVREGKRKEIKKRRNIYDDFTTLIPDHPPGVRPQPAGDGDGLAVARGRRQPDYPPVRKTLEQREDTRTLIDIPQPGGIDFGKGGAQL